MRAYGTLFLELDGWATLRLMAASLVADFLHAVIQVNTSFDRSHSNLACHCVLLLHDLA